MEGNKKLSQLLIYLGREVVKSPTREGICQQELILKVQLVIQEMLGQELPEYWETGEN